MSTNNNKLFSEFDSVSTEQWLEKVNADLKGADFDKKLVWKNLSKINIQPCYSSTDTINELKNSGENSQALLNYRAIEVSNVEAANKLALKAVEEGMNGIIFRSKDNIAVDILLSNIDLNETAIAFEGTVEIAKSFFAFAKGRVKAENLKGYFDNKVFTHFLKKGTFKDNAFEELIDLIELSKDYPNYKVISISGTEYLDSGANQVQDVAYTLNSLVYLIDELSQKGVDIQSIFDNLNFKFAVGLEYFIEIAKFRAFNNLLVEVAAKYGVLSLNNTLLAKTSIWSKSVTDAETNMLRATTEAMSAILGNVDGIVVDAYDKEYKAPSDFSSRIAGNITTILREESYFGKVANPVDGSYYVEEVTAKIAENALELFKAIENEGGFVSAFENETIQQQIAEIRLQKLKLISQRRLPLVGVNKYPNLMENVKADILADSVIENPKVLTPRRASLEIEMLRRVTEELVAETGSRPIVELASFGNLTMRKARAGFAYDFIGVSGFEVQQEKSFESAEIAAEQSAKSESNVVVMCSSDQDYDEKALEFVKSFRAINTDKVLILAGAPANMDELTEAGLDGVVNMRTDVIKTLSSIQEKVKKTFTIKA